MYTLYIGNKNVSSWSLRAWVLMRVAGIEFEERLIPLDRADTPKRIREVSPSGRVPCLHDDGTIVWDTLAIAEYLAESRPELWPDESQTRSWARSVSAEMHSGFAALREEFSMDLGVREARAPSARSAADIARIHAIWNEGRARFGGRGDFLCGHFGIVDAFWCPVAFRFRSYGVTATGAALGYRDALLALPAMREWDAAAALERTAAPA